MCSSARLLSSCNGAAAGDRKGDNSVTRVAGADSPFGAWTEAVSTWLA
jgi:hypothetical protein